MDSDLKITGGTIYDGTGAPGRAGGVAVKDGKIAPVGEASGKATTTLEAKGKVVAPGFVDIHTHCDAQVMWDRMMTISPWHGVTTVVMGNCGFGMTPTRPEHRGLIMIRRQIVHTPQCARGRSPSARTRSAGSGPSPIRGFAQPSC